MITTAPLVPDGVEGGANGAYQIITPLMLPQKITHTHTYIHIYRHSHIHLESKFTPPSTQWFVFMSAWVCVCGCVHVFTAVASSILLTQVLAFAISNFLNPLVQASAAPYAKREVATHYEI